MGADILSGSSLTSEHFSSNRVSLRRNRTRGPGPRRAVQHAGLRRVSVERAVQRSGPPQIRAEESGTSSVHVDGRSGGQTARGGLARVLPGQAGGVQLWGVASHHPTHVCGNRSRASGQHRWGACLNLE